jgi:signal transduction histidine kinase
MSVVPLNGLLPSSLQSPFVPISLRPPGAIMTAHTVLVVDDEPASLRAIARALHDGSRVITVATAAQGLAALASEPIALMIVDQRMPEMAGTELLERAAVEHPETIRVLLTGYTGIDTLVEAINSGHVYYYLTKPWEPHELRLVVRRGLERYDVEADRRRLIRELEQACQRAQRQADQKGRLLALATHELGTPLHVLSNALVLMAETGVPAAARSWLDTAHRSAEWLARGLAQMAMAARWRTGGLKLNPAPVDLTGVLREVRATFEHSIGGRGLALKFDVPEVLPRITGDRLWLERALFNLISNAVRFTRDGGSVTVTAAAAAAAVEISVADTGVGIDASLLEEVFEPFSAAGGEIHLHTSGRFEFGSRGLGLGLAITKAIIEQHGGTISVQSQPGAGSRFTAMLPANFPRVVPERFR